MASLEDTERVTQLVKAHSPALLAYFVRRVEDPADAADLLSDLLTVVWRRIRSIPRSDSEARMWMYGVARRVLSTHRRGIRRRTNLQEQLRANLSIQEPLRPTDEIELHEALRMLDPLDQEIVRLVHWDGLAQVEVGRLLGMPAATVRSRHSRARTQLRETLGAQAITRPN